MSIEALKHELKTLKTSQYRVAPSKGSAHAFGLGELWCFYEEAIASLNQVIGIEQSEQSKPPTASLRRRIHDHYGQSLL
jgi:hypothetical protein